jgi:hypothetical protein
LITQANFNFPSSEKSGSYDFVASSRTIFGLLFSGIEDLKDASGALEFI